MIDYTGTETRKIFFRMLTMAKTFEELLTLNGIAVSVQCVFKAGFNEQLRRMQIYVGDDKKRRLRKKVTSFLKWQS